MKSYLNSIAFGTFAVLSSVRFLNMGFGPMKYFGRTGISEYVILLVSCSSSKCLFCEWPFLPHWWDDSLALREVSLVQANLNIDLSASSFTKVVKGDSASSLTHCLIAARMISYFVEVRKSSRADHGIKPYLFESVKTYIESLQDRGK